MKELIGDMGPTNTNTDGGNTTTCNQRQTNKRPDVKAIDVCSTCYNKECSAMLSEVANGHQSPRGAARARDDGRKGGAGGGKEGRKGEG